MTPWIDSITGDVIVDGSGAPILCGSCPCVSSSSSSSSSSFGYSSSSSSSSSFAVDSSSSSSSGLVLPNYLWGTRDVTGLRTYCLRVQRQSDSTTQDIGWSSGYVDESAISTFCGAAEGSPAYFYEQIASGANMVGNGAPRYNSIYKGFYFPGGANFVYAGGKVAWGIRFGGTSFSPGMSCSLPTFASDPAVSIGICQTGYYTTGNGTIWSWLFNVAGTAYTRFTAYSIPVLMRWRFQQNTTAGYQYNVAGAASDFSEVGGVYQYSPYQAKFYVYDPGSPVQTRWDTDNPSYSVQESQTTDNAPAFSGTTSTGWHNARYTNGKSFSSEFRIYRDNYWDDRAEITADILK